MEILAYTRTERVTAESKKDDCWCIPGTGDPDGVLPDHWFHGADRKSVDHFLAQDLDVVVICLPLTQATTKIIGREQFEILSKKKTFVINIARGKHIDTDALVDALEQGQICGAALDVTEPEPLPSGHPLWKAPNVFITPHVSWSTPFYWDRCLKILENNLERLATGNRPINLINKQENY
jgi:phosphoglycerate dehydrogenase-like enzyme